MKKVVLLAIVIVACVCLAACGGGNGGKVQNVDVNNGETGNLQEPANYQEPVEDTSKPLNFWDTPKNSKEKSTYLGAFFKAYFISYSYSS